MARCMHIALIAVVWLVAAEASSSAGDFAPPPLTVQQLSNVAKTLPNEPHSSLSTHTSTAVANEQLLGASSSDPGGPAAAAAAADEKTTGFWAGLQANQKGSVKPLWPLDGFDFAVMAIIMFSLSLAGGAGIGGGAILVPIFLMLRGWPTAVAVSLSNVTILGGSFANFICNVTRHRPNGKRTIDWELILMMEPTTIAGALVGAVANKLLPNWITTYLLAILLTLMALRLYTKGKQTYAKETQLLLSAKAASKERHLERHRNASLNARGGSQSERQGSANGGIAVPASRQLQHSGSRKDVLGRSLSRLRGSLVVDLERTPSQTPGSGARSFSVGSLRSQSARYRQLPGVDDGRDTGVDQELPEPALEKYVRGTLFQGDLDGDFEGVVVALSPSDDDLSPVPSGDTTDLEAALDAADQDAPELARPLLTDADRADDGNDVGRTSPDQSHSRRNLGQAAAPGSTKQWEAPNGGSQESPDMTVHLGVVELPGKVPTLESSLPLPHFFTLLGLSAWVVAADILQGSFQCGSWQYWASQLSVLIPVFTILAVFREVLLKKYRHDDLPEGHQLPDGELHWTKKTTVLYPLLCSTAGLIAGLFGIGGGVVKGPLMLELGVPADVAAATSATMIMYTSCSACLVYIRFGQILYDYAAVLVVLGFSITLCSQLLTFLLIKLLGRRSIIVFMMVALMAAATAIMYVQSGLVTADLIQHPEDLWKFGHLCPSGNNLLKWLGQALMARLH